MTPSFVSSGSAQNFTELESVAHTRPVIPSELQSRSLAQEFRQRRSEAQPSGGLQGSCGSQGVFFSLAG